MERKSITYKIGESEYIFSERNREDVCLSSLQERVRAQKFKFIQDNVKDGDHQLALLMDEMKKFYSGREIVLYVFSNQDEMYKAAYDSFKLKQPNISFEDFKKKIPEKEIMNIVELVNKLETPEEEDKKKAESESVKKSRKR
ncbi:MAG: hypothetical protein C4539_14575 [Ignavibacteriales bacterium]|nr:MAG: hypothetical protein C4539_14575 [Ignavibacteriales bacterium]